MHLMMKDLEESPSTVAFGPWPPSNGAQLSEGRPMTTLVRDLRPVVRVLLGTKAWTLAVLLSLALSGRTPRCSPR